MSNKPPSRKGPPSAPGADRRAALGPPGADRRAEPGSPEALRRRLKGVLARPLTLERRGLQLHVVLVERRRAPPSDEPPTLPQMRAEVRARLLAYENEPAGQVMRHLGFVHDELGRKGWPGVAVLPAQVLHKARVQAEMLASEEASAALALLIEQLRPLQVAAELREERKPPPRRADAEERVEVSEATHEEFEAMERSWVGTRPDGLELPDSAAP